MFELQLASEASRPYLHRLGARPVYIGRAPTNDLVVSESTVSSRHLSVWVAEGEVWVEDLHSRNGTRINGVALQGAKRIVPGDEVRLGAAVRVTVRRMDSTDAPPLFLLEDLSTGVRRPVRRERTSLGSGPDDDVQLAGLPPRAGALFVFPDELWLGIDDSMQEIRAGEPFSVGEYSLVLRAPSDRLQATRELEDAQSSVQLSVCMAGPTQQYAVVTDQGSGRVHRLTADTRVALLYVLGQQLLHDRSKALPEAMQGWCPDRTVITGVWGRMSLQNPENSLNVLVGRVRRELKSAGLDPWFLEKKRGFLRARVRAVDLESSTH